MVLFNIIIIVILFNIKEIGLYMGICYCEKQKVKTQYNVKKYSSYSKSTTFKDINASKQSTNISDINFTFLKKMKTPGTLIQVQPVVRPILTKLIKKKLNKSEISSNNETLHLS